MTDKKIKLSDVLGRKRKRPRTAMEFIEQDGDGRWYLLEVEVGAQEGTHSLRLSRAFALAFGPTLGQLLSGGGLHVNGVPVSFEEIVGAPALAGNLLGALVRVAEAIPEDELVELLVRLLAGCTRFRVSRTQTPDKFSGNANDYGEFGEWIDVEDDDNAREVLDDLFPTMRHMLMAGYQSAMINVLPTSRAGRTAGASSTDETPPQPAATK